MANSITGKTPEDVCAKIPEIFRILHIESVVRSDLAAKLFRRQAEIRDDLGKCEMRDPAGDGEEGQRIADIDKPPRQSRCDVSLHKRRSGPFYRSTGFHQTR